MGGMLFTMSARPWQQAPNPMLFDRVSKASVADLARLVAQSGFSAGFVITLPQDKEDTLARVAGSRGQMMARSGFGVWLNSELGATDWGPQRLGSLDELGDVLTRFAARSSGEWVVAPARHANVSMLKAKDATLCQARLTPVVGKLVENRDLITTISTIVRDTTGAAVPRGFIGSCIGAHQFVEQPITVGSGVTLEDALNSTVSAFGSSVWIAVQSRSGVCSIGVIQSGMNGGVCTTAITDNIPQK